MPHINYAVLEFQFFCRFFQNSAQNVQNPLNQNLMFQFFCRFFPQEVRPAA